MFRDVLLVLRIYLNVLCLGGSPDTSDRLRAFRTDCVRLFCASAPDLSAVLEIATTVFPLCQPDGFIFRHRLGVRGLTF